jgi:hypothetical protein
MARRTISSTTAQKKAGSEVLNFNLSGLANERSFEGRAVRIQVLAGESTHQEKA